MPKPNELLTAVELPNEDEVIFPIFRSGGDSSLVRQIELQKIVDYIVDEVSNNQEVIIHINDNALYFSKKHQGA